MAAPLATAMMANTIDAAPRSPAQDTSRHCRTPQRKGASSRKTAAGRATKVRNTIMAKAGRKTAGSCRGKESSPSRKKIKICARPVSPSKKWTRAALWGILAFPIRMPAR